ncbi:protein-tyrosine phosphatase-like protein [Lactifluus volemus]|nr:protein-tyrosine phosphatase-like protein [Lactifluus volemus]
MKKLSLSLSTQSSSSSLAFPRNDVQLERATQEDRCRRTSSVSSLSTSSMLLRREEDSSPSPPYLDGPIEILPNIWLGAEDNVRDWRNLVTRRIGSILNVAKEVVSPLDIAIPAEVPRTRSTEEGEESPGGALHNKGAYYSADSTGRPGLHYLKLEWSHGQSDLVHRGFPEAMAFVDEALDRGEGVLIHCQCGISRSATLVIALVMRAASLSSPWVPQDVWNLKGMQAAYAYVKQRSKWVGPNMSLIYQLLEYEKVLRGPYHSPTASERSRLEAAADEEWSRRRKMLDDEVTDLERESLEIQREARALDKAMEDRILARKSSSSSIAARKSRYSARKRTGSVASNMTSNSVLSENLVEEDEEVELLGVGGDFDRLSARPSPSDPHLPSDASSDGEPQAPHPPSVPPAFKLPLFPLTSFSHRPLSLSKARRRPTPLDILPTVPDSPVSLVPTPTIPPPPYHEVAKSPVLQSDSRRKSLVDLMMPSTPTTAHARVDARGWVGIY